MSDRHFLDSFAKWSAHGQPLVLATVVGTDGSTYRKTGAQMLLTGDGRFAGLLSGGCLEGDLAQHAREVIQSGEARVVRYDMRDARHDELWGLGLGCNGLIEILLQALLPGEGYQPYAAVAKRLASRMPVGQLIVVASVDSGIKPGASVFWDAVGSTAHGVPASMHDDLLKLARTHVDERAAGVHFAHDSLELVVLSLRPPPRLILLGGGPDAVPVMAIAGQLGWDCVVYDHRPAYTERLRREGYTHVCDRISGESLPTDALEGADAVVIMSHHLATDLHYLRQVADSQVPYVGLLGPSARRERLLADLGDAAEELVGRLYAPVGLDLGGEGPAAIALSVIAQVHAIVHGRAGGPRPC